MVKTVFKNQNFYIALITGIGILICWNIYVFLNSQNITALIPALVQIIVLVLMFTKNKYAKLGITIWSIILIGSSALSILGKTVKILLGDDISVMIYALIIKIVFLFFGLTIYHYNKTTVELKKLKKQNKNNMLQQRTE